MLYKNNAALFLMIQDNKKHKVLVRKYFVAPSCLSACLLLLYFFPENHHHYCYT